MKKQLEHANRNKALSEQLLVDKKYFDWVITTAFYSAIHFVENKLLPIEISKLKCRNINEVMRAYNMRGRHASRERLVCDNLNMDVAVKYKWLDDKSRYARYTTYKVTSAEADKAKQYLDEICKACL
ncbi:MAG: hypothetical protein WED10_02145 [Brumimicrobium sp.]